MSMGPFGVGELVSAARLAWTVYNACQSAPREFKALSEEVEALYIVLESVKRVVLDAGLDASRTDDLNRVSQGCITVLTELDALMNKYRSLGSSGRTWDKLRWGQEKIEPLRGRLVSNISLLTAFNSSLMNASQTTVIARLDQMLADIQAGRKDGSSISDLTAELQAQGNQDDTLQSVPHKSADHHPQSAGEGDTVPIPPGQLIIHAAYRADQDVTQLLRSLVSRDQTLQIDTRHSLPSSDPWYNVLKTISIMYQYTDGPLQLIVCDDASGMIFIGPSSPPQRHYFNPAGRHAEKLNILAVVWGGMHGHPGPLDAAQFRWIAEKRKFPCTNEWFGFDGRLNWRKTCHVFYEFGTTGTIHCMAAREGDTIVIPADNDSQIPAEGKLTIHAAYWADQDVTELLRSQVLHDQTLQVNTTPYLQLPDPWFGVLKTISIMYQYTNGPLQLLICDDSRGMISISQTSPLRRNFFNPAERHDGKLNVLAVVWGSMYSRTEPLDPSQFRWIAEIKRFPCSTEWFRFDGQPYWPKTCHVFYEFGTTGMIGCVAAREGEECCLPGMPV